jgi:hypothetical protein
MPSDATNLASEFYVLSILHRLGASAALTLNNRKSVDIIVARSKGDAVTIDVKGAAGITGFFVNNQIEGKPNHFVVFVSYLSEFDDPSVEPEVHIVPSIDVKNLAEHYPNRNKYVVRLVALRRHIPSYRNNWKQIL